MSHFSGHFEGASTFLTPKLSLAALGAIYNNNSYNTMLSDKYILPLFGYYFQYLLLCKIRQNVYGTSRILQKVFSIEIACINVQIHTESTA